MNMSLNTISYQKSVATFIHAGPAPTELTPRAKLAKTSANEWRISWLHDNPRDAGSEIRARYEFYKGTVIIAAALSAGCTQRTSFGISSMAS
jgi:hypothetical protein